MQEETRQEEDEEEEKQSIESYALTWEVINGTGNKQAIQSYSVRNTNWQNAIGKILGGLKTGKVQQRNPLGGNLDTMNQTKCPYTLSRS
jgi:hypothetical protein